MNKRRTSIMGSPKKVGATYPGRGKIKRIRTIKPNRRTYIRVGVVSTKGPRGGTTVSGPVRKIKKRKR